MVDYQIHDISEKQFKLGYWFFAHKNLVAKIPQALMIIWCLLTLGYSFYGFAAYVINLSNDQQMVGAIAVNHFNFAEIKNRLQPQQLIITEPQIVYGGPQLYDFVAQVKNPNLTRGVTNLSYQFISNDYVTPTSSVVIKPDQTVFLLSLGNESKKRLTAAKLKIISTNWQSAWQRQPAEQIAIDVDKPKLESSSAANHSWISFNAINNSLKNIWEIKWQAVLFSGKRVAGVNQISSEQFLAGESRLVEMSWFDKLPKITQMEVVPLVDVYNPANFYETPGQAGELR